MDRILHVIALVFSMAGTIWLLVELARTKKLSGFSGVNLNNMDAIGEGSNAMRDAIAGQFHSQLLGFGLLLVGQIIDFVSTLCN